MNVRIREYGPKDAQAVISIFREIHEAYKKSKGGYFPDGEIDAVLAWSDEKILSYTLGNSSVFVAEVQETKEVVGMAGILTGKSTSLLKSVRGRLHFVKKTHQGKGIGRMLRENTLSEAKSLGFIKLFGYCNDNAVDFHKKFGAKFYPACNKNSPVCPSVKLNYYEIVLRPSLWNRFRR